MRFLSGRGILCMYAGLGDGYMYELKGTDDFEWDICMCVELGGGLRGIYSGTFIWRSVTARSLSDLLDDQMNEERCSNTTLTATIVRPIRMSKNRLVLTRAPISKSPLLPISIHSFI